MVWDIDRSRDEPKVQPQGENDEEAEYNAFEVQVLSSLGKALVLSLADCLISFI